MIAIKTDMRMLPDFCDECRWYETRPHPLKGWTDFCALMMECMDDDAKEGWCYDGNGRPENCPLIEV